MNLVKRRVFVSLFTDRRSFLITNPAVDALITKVRIEQPAILNKDIKVNFCLSMVSAARISANAIPTAPLRPPYVKMTTSFHLRPYP